MSSQYAGSEVFPTDFTIPDDGDERAATSVNVALEALGDRTEYLRTHTLLNVARYTNDSFSATFSDVVGTYNAPSSGGTVSIPNVRVGDVLLWRCMASVTRISNSGKFRVFLTQDFGGTNVGTALPGVVEVDASWPANMHVPATFNGSFVATVAGTAKFDIQGLSNGATGAVKIDGSLVMTVEHVRLP